MAELSTRYATALLDLSMESGLLNEYLSQAAFVRDVLETDEFMRIIEHPAISTADKHNILSSTFAGRVGNDLLGFLYMVIAKNREKFLLPALTAFINMAETHNKKNTANVVSATEFSQEQILQLKNLLSSKLNKHVEIITKVDSSLLGGLYIQVDGYLLDKTIKKQLCDMKNIIKKV